MEKKAFFTNEGAFFVDDKVKENSCNLVTSGAVYDAINGAGGAKEIVYFDVDPSDPPSGIYAAITEALSNGKEPVIKNAGAVYFFSATGTDKYVFVGGYNTEVVNYITITVSDDDSVVKEVVDTIEGMIFPLYFHSENEQFTVADKSGTALTKTDIANAYRAGQIFMFSSYPAANTQAHWGYCCNIDIDSENTGYAEFFILSAFGGDSYQWEKYRINLSSGTEFVTLWGPNTSYSRGMYGKFADAATTVSVATSQSFDATQKAQARNNIGACGNAPDDAFYVNRGGSWVKAYDLQQTPIEGFPVDDTEDYQKIGEFNGYIYPYVKIEVEGTATVGLFNYDTKEYDDEITLTDEAQTAEISTRGKYEIHAKGTGIVTVVVSADEFEAEGNGNE